MIARRLRRFSPPATCILYAIGIAMALVLAWTSTAHGEYVFPGAEWATRSPQEAGMDPSLVDQAAQLLGGRGCIIKDGYVVKTWGDQAEISDWYSSAKPFLSTMLFFAIQEGLVKSVDEPIADFGWELKPKDRTMTFRHLGAMTSGYALPEAPGEAWAYNDFAIQLYQKTLFDKVFKDADAVRVSEDPKRLGALGLQDGLKFNDKHRLYASVRDFSRIVWFWMNRGEWNGKRVLDRRFFDDYMKPQVPKMLPRTRKAEEDDYLHIGSYGGGCDQCYYGSGAYGFNWWFNGTGWFNPDALMWPDAPRDTIMSIGYGGNCSAFFPSLGVAVVCSEGSWRDVTPGSAASPMNQALMLVSNAAGFQPETLLITGEARKWHDLTFSLRGPDSSESSDPNPFTDYRLEATFTCGKTQYIVPGYYAADGNAANSSLDAGNIWRVHFMPDREGEWKYRISFRTGPGVAIADAPDAGKPVAFDGLSGSVKIGPTDKAAPDFRARGLLLPTGKRYLQFAETGEYFLKGGADSPENFLAFADFDGTPPTHHYEPHAGDHKLTDPTWGSGSSKGGNILGALNYLAGKGMNSVYMITMNVNGDGKDVWPWTSDAERRRFDCSKLDQWEQVFSHMDTLGLAQHIVTQEQENDQLLDGGELGPDRKLYYRELIARFAHHPALFWNLGEENTNTTEQRKAFADYIRKLDPYKHPIVIHTFPSEREQVYSSLLGFPALDGPSLQLTHMEETHAETLKWVQRSGAAGKQWFVCLDEFGPPDVGVRSDADDPGHDNVRTQALWGNLMAGGAGCEWFFQSDIHCEDWRLRDHMWDQTRAALAFFHQCLPFPNMEPRDDLVAAGQAWCLAKPGQVYAVYTFGEGPVQLNLEKGRYQVSWYDPQAGGKLIPGTTVEGPGAQALGNPPNNDRKDWAILVQSK